MAAVETASNTGSGAPVFKQKTGTDLEFRSLTATQGLRAEATADEVQLGYSIAITAASTGVTADSTSIDASSVDLPPQANTASNIGTGVGLFADKQEADLRFKSLIGGGGLEVRDLGVSVSIGYPDAITAASTIITADCTDLDSSNMTSLPEANYGVNLGGGAAVYKDKVGPELRFRSLKAGLGLAVVESKDALTISYGDIITAASTDVTADDVTIDASNDTELPESNDGRNLGSGIGLFKDKDGPFLQFKSLRAGTNLDLVNGAESITLNAVNSTTASNLSGVGLFKEEVGDDLRFKGLVAGTNIVIDDNPDYLQISTLGTSGALPWFNVKEYGAVGDGVSDDYSAVVAAITAVPTSGGVLYFPDGSYLLSGRPVVSNRSISILGDGVGVTELIWSNPSQAGLAIFQNDETFHTTVRSMTMKAPGPVVGQIALEIDYTQSQIDDRDAAIITVSDLMIMPMIEATGGWFEGIRLVDGHGARIDNITLTGNNADKNPAARTVSKHGIHLVGSWQPPTEIVIERIRAFYWDQCIRISSDTPTGQDSRVEGVKIGNCDFVSVGSGVFVDINDTNLTLHIAVYNTHVNFFQRGVYLSNTSQGFVTNCLLYHNPISVSHGQGIWVRRQNTLAPPESTIISGNTIRSNNSNISLEFNAIIVEGIDATVIGNIIDKVETGIWLKKTTLNDNPSTMTVTGNVITEGVNGIYLQNAENISVFSNVFRGVTYPVQKISGSNIFVKNEFLGSLVFKSSDFSPGVISWDADSYDFGDFFVGGTRLTIPQGKGVNLVKLSCHATTNGNGSGNSGDFVINIRLNGSGTYIGEGRSRQAGIPMNQIASATAATAILAVTPGDYFECELGLTEGSFRADRCWFAIEVIG